MIGFKNYDNEIIHYNEQNNIVTFDKDRLQILNQILEYDNIYGKFYFRFYILNKISDYNIFVNQISYSKTQLRIRPIENLSIIKWNEIYNNITLTNSIIYKQNLEYKYLILNKIKQNEIFNDSYGSIVLKINQIINQNLKDQIISISQLLHFNILQQQFVIQKPKNEQEIIELVQDEQFQNNQVILQSQNLKNYNQILQHLNDKQIQLRNNKIQKININVNYNNFKEFVHFGNINLKFIMFINKIKELQSLNNNFKKQFINKFDNYQKYLYINQFPKQDGNILPLEDNNVKLWISQYQNKTIQYDKINLHSLINFIPQFIKKDIYNQQYIRFVYMIGNYFDYIWCYQKSITKLLQIQLQQPSLQWLLMKSKYKFIQQLKDIIVDFDLQQYYSEQYKIKSLYNNLINSYDLIIKNKGNKNSIEILMNCLDDVGKYQLYKSNYNIRIDTNIDFDNLTIKKNNTKKDNNILIGNIVNNPLIHELINISTFYEDINNLKGDISYLNNNQILNYTLENEAKPYYVDDVSKLQIKWLQTIQKLTDVSSSLLIGSIFQNLQIRNNKVKLPQLNYFITIPKFFNLLNKNEVLSQKIRIELVQILNKNEVLSQKIRMELVQILNKNEIGNCFLSSLKNIFLKSSFSQIYINRYKNFLNIFEESIGQKNSKYNGVKEVLVIQTTTTNKNRLILSQKNSQKLKIN